MPSRSPRQANRRRTHVGFTPQGEGSHSQTPPAHTHPRPCFWRDRGAAILSHPPPTEGEGGRSGLRRVVRGQGARGVVMQRIGGGGKKGGFGVSTGAGTEVRSPGNPHWLAETKRVNYPRTGCRKSAWKIALRSFRNAPSSFLIGCGNNL